MFDKGKRLYSAVQQGKLEEVKRLLGAGANPNWRDSDGWSPLHTSVNNGPSGQEGIVSLLVAAGADVKAKTTDGDTPLHLAVAQRKRMAVQELLDNGADPNARDGAGRTPLQQIAYSVTILEQPLVIEGKWISNDEEIRECRELAALLVRNGAIS